MVSEISANQTKNMLQSSKSMSIDISSTTATINTDGTQSFSADTVSLRSSSFSALTYDGSLQLQDAANAGYEKLRSYVQNLLKEQGITTKVATDIGEIDLTTVTPDQAQDLISENGYFGVDQTSERIFQFAVGIAGGDISRINAIKEGIDKGFAEAKKAFGDWLPQISYDTYDAVMKKLDNWVADTQAVA
jgi:hypothetical protein